MLLIFCAIGAALITAGAAVSLGLGPTLAVAGAFTIALAVAWDVLYDEVDEPDGDSE